MTQRRRTLVTGGRTYARYEAVEHVLNMLTPTSIRHGNAAGADSLAARYGTEKGVPTFAYPPDRSLDGPGRDWKFRRNERMLLTAKPDIVVAFPGGPGTDHMVRTARRHGYPVWDLRSNDRPAHLPDWLTAQEEEEPSAPAQKPAPPANPEPKAAPLPKTLGRTSVTTVEQKELLQTGKGFVDTYDWVINPYQGCSFGCHYCYASNFPNSPADRENWGLWVKVKQNAAAMLRKHRPGSLNGKTIYMATATDPYQPVERQARITREILKILAESHPGVKLVVQTRAELVNRDADLLQAINETGGRVQVNMTITTDDDAVRRLYEPGCSSTAARTKAAIALQAQGIQTAVTVTPMLPMTAPAEFAERLLEGGVRRFIIQALHTDDRRRGTQVAITDRRAIETAKLYYHTEDPAEAMARYRAQYARNADEFTKAVRSRPDTVLGTGKQGFRPPF